MKLWLEVWRFKFALSLWSRRHDTDAEIRASVYVAFGRRLFEARWYRTGVDAALGRPYRFEARRVG